MTSSPAEPVWLTLEDVLAIHEDQIAHYGGASGVRDLGLIESALHRPRQQYDYDSERDILMLAIRLGLGIARNHGFVDGNKRAGAVAMIEFLAINSAWLDMPNDTGLADLFLRALAKEITEDELADTLYPFIVI